MDTFGTRLRIIREGRSLRQDDIAHALGISKQLVSMWENGKRYPGLDMFMALIQYLGVDSGDLIPETNSDGTPKVYHILMKDMQRDLTPEERAAVQTYARFIIEKDTRGMA